MQSSQKQILNRIYGNGRGYAFSPKDFSKLCTRSSIDIALHRLMKKGTIRRVLRGIYDYPKYSDLLEQELSPDIDQVAQALARKFRWTIQPSGPAALNLLGLSTQVPSQYIYHSSGPNRSYAVGQTGISFQTGAAKEASFKYPQSALMVQALKSLGKGEITPEAISHIRLWLDPALRAKALKDTSRVTDWIYQAIRNICREEDDG